VWRIVGEKIPLFLLTVLFCVAIFAFQSGQGSVQSLAQLSLEARLLNAVTVYAIYIRKLFWPVDLAFFYPHPGATLSYWNAALAGVILLAISAGAILLRRRGPFLIVGWLWYLGTLVPVIGLVQVGRQQMADRYTYFPLIGLFIALTWGICAVVPKHRFRQMILAALGACVLLPAMVLTQRQASHWSESTRLFSHALEVTEDNAFAHTNLGGALQKAGRLTESIAQHEAAIEIDPTEAMYHYNLAFTLVSLERFDEAIERFKRAVELLPESPLSYFQLGSLYYRRGDAKAAADFLRQALERDPDFAEAHHHLGRLLQRQGDAERAQYHLGQAMQLRPDLYPMERDASR
jgi:tetratricopeptide (TPR) repeat protein